MAKFVTEQQIELAIDTLKRGGIVAYPTDTVYGLGASIEVEEAVERVYQVKQRERHLPLPLLLSDISQIAKVADFVPEVAWKLAKHFLPGGLTLILVKSSLVPEVVSGGNTVAVRIPAHPVPLALIRGLGVPITGTSANLSGKPSPITAQEVEEQLGDKVDLIIDGGRCPYGVESTIVDVTGQSLRIVREGAIPKEEIERICTLPLDVTIEG